MNRTIDDRRNSLTFPRRRITQVMNVTSITFASANIADRHAGSPAPRFGHMLLVDVIGPVVEMLGYLLIPALWLLGLLSVEYLLAFLAVSFTFGVVISVGALALEESELRRFPKARHLVLLACMAVVENFGYRQLSNVWRLRGTWQFLRKSQSWGTMTRKGFARQTRSA